MQDSTGFSLSWGPLFYVMSLPEEAWPLQWRSSGGVSPRQPDEWSHLPRPSSGHGGCSGTAPDVAVTSNWSSVAASSSLGPRFSRPRLMRPEPRRSRRCSLERSRVPAGQRRDRECLVNVSQPMCVITHGVQNVHNHYEPDPATGLVRQIAITERRDKAPKVTPCPLTFRGSSLFETRHRNPPDRKLARRFSDESARRDSGDDRRRLRLRPIDTDNGSEGPGSPIYSGLEESTGSVGRASSPPVVIAVGMDLRRIRPSRARTAISRMTVVGPAMRSFTVFHANSRARTFSQPGPPRSTIPTQTTIASA